MAPRTWLVITTATPNSSASLCSVLRNLRRRAKGQVYRLSSFYTLGSNIIWIRKARELGMGNWLTVIHDRRQGKWSNESICRWDNSWGISVEWCNVWILWYLPRTFWRSASIPLPQYSVRNKAVALSIIISAKRDSDIMWAAETISFSCISVLWALATATLFRTSVGSSPNLCIQKVWF